MYINEKGQAVAGPVVKMSKKILQAKIKHLFIGWEVQASIFKVMVQK